MTEARVMAAADHEVGATMGSELVPAAEGISARPRATPWAIRLATILGRYGALIALAVMMVGFSLASPYFLTVHNLLEMVNQAALPIIISVGLTFVLATGEFDLSIGQLASLSGMMATLLILHGVPILVAVLVCLAVGVLGGALNGFLVVKLEINALIATLGTGTCFLGLTYLLTGGSPITILDPSFIGISMGNWFGVPRPVLYMVVISAVLWVLLNETSFGQHVRAVGSNADAAKLVGIRVGLTKIAGFVLSGALATLVGVLLASLIGSGQPTAANDMTLGAFAACFLGSTVMSEGRFHVVGTVVGGIVVAAGFSGLALVGVPSYVQQLFQGGLLIIAVALSSIGRRLARD